MKKVIVLWVALATLLPVLTLWALNTLFGLAIPYTFKCWFACLVLLCLIRRGGVSATFTWR